eukprot:1155582-Pelagomonas_calceolata.AAC.1
MLHTEAQARSFSYAMDPDLKMHPCRGIVACKTTGAPLQDWGWVKRAAFLSKEALKRAIWAQGDSPVPFQPKTHPSLHNLFMTGVLFWQGGVQEDVCLSQALTYTMLLTFHMEASILCFAPEWFPVHGTSRSA